MIDWRAARVLVTGGQGFLGKHILAALPGAGAVYSPGRNRYDLRNWGQTVMMFADLSPNIVIHAAGEVGGIGAMKEKPADFWHDNLLLGLNVMRAARIAHVHKMVVVGSVCAYPKNAPTPFVEADLWNGYPEETSAAYGLAKRMMAEGCRAYREQYGFNAIYLLMANLYGPGDNFDPQTSHVIPAMIRKCLAAKKAGAGSVELWGDGTPTREFLYVEDAAEAVVAAAGKYDKVEPVNIGVGAEVSMKELFELVAGVTGYGGRAEWDATRPGGQPRRVLDVQRAKSEFGWAARVPLRDGLEKTVGWYVTRLLDPLR